jgi:pimeloyl-ACP methyl ester carboxylesterase
MTLIDPPAESMANEEIRYWDVQLDPENHSYVDAAIREGYSIFIYDRLGTGQSQKPDGYKIVQAPVEVEILKELTILARNGGLIKSARVLSGNRAACTIKPKKVIHVGHSFGSAVTIGFLESYGQLSDGAIITSLIVNDQVSTIGPDSKGLSFAAETYPQRFGDRPSNYLIQDAKEAIQLIFFGKDSFEPKFLDYAQSISDTATTMEYLTGALVVGGSATQFKGPIQVRRVLFP